MKLVDTSVVVDYLRGHDDAVDLLEALVVTDDVLASELTRFELLAGVRERELERLEAFCSAIPWIGVDTDVARVAGAFAQRHRRSHSGIDDVDYLIAATAVVADARLVTTNVRHYPMFPDLRAPY